MPEHSAETEIALLKQEVHRLEEDLEKEVKLRKELDEKFTDFKGEILKKGWIALGFVSALTVLGTVVKFVLDYLSKWQGLS